MDICVHPDNPSCAVITCKQFHYSFAFIVQECLKHYTGPLGKVVLCSIVPFKQDYSHVSWRVQVAWASPNQSNNFRLLMNNAMDQISSRYNEIVAHNEQKQQHSSIEA